MKKITEHKYIQNSLIAYLTSNIEGNLVLIDKEVTCRGYFAEKRIDVATGFLWKYEDSDDFYVEYLVGFEVKTNMQDFRCGRPYDCKANYNFLVIPEEMLFEVISVFKKSVRDTSYLGIITTDGDNFTVIRKARYIDSKYHQTWLLNKDFFIFNSTDMEQKYHSLFNFLFESKMYSLFNSKDLIFN